MRARSLAAGAEGVLRRTLARLFGRPELLFGARGRAFGGRRPALDRGERLRVVRIEILERMALEVLFERARRVRQELCRLLEAALALLLAGARRMSVQIRLQIAELTRLVPGVARELVEAGDALALARTGRPALRDQRGQPLLALDLGAQRPGERREIGAHRLAKPELLLRRRGLLRVGVLLDQRLPVVRARAREPALTLGVRLRGRVRGERRVDLLDELLWHVDLVG